MNAGYRLSVIILIAGSFRRGQNGSRKSALEVVRYYSGDDGISRVLSRERKKKKMGRRRRKNSVSFLKFNPEREPVFSLAKIPSAPRENGAFRLRGNLKRKENIPIAPGRIVHYLE